MHKLHYWLAICFLMAEVGPAHSQKIDSPEPFTSPPIRSRPVDQQRSTPPPPPPPTQYGVNIGSLQCTIAGGTGFIFGSSKDLDCLLVRTDGVAEHYSGSINRFGVDIGFTKEAHIVWVVFAPGAIGPGALAGDYSGVTAGASFGVGVGANVLVGGSTKQIALQPVSVEGSVGLNVAAGVAAVSLRTVR